VLSMDILDRGSIYEYPWIMFLLFTIDDFQIFITEIYLKIGINFQQQKLGSNTAVSTDDYYCRSAFSGGRSSTIRALRCHFPISPFLPVNDIMIWSDIASVVTVYMQYDTVIQ
jgi:hypothetical protein